MNDLTDSMKFLPGKNQMAQKVIGHQLHLLLIRKKFIDNPV